MFSRDNSGFDAFVGNPPFAGVVTLSRSTAQEYTPYLREMFPQTGGKADLVAFFFRRCFSLLRGSGCFGLIATNTIGQGDTRASGLRHILQNGGSIVAAISRNKWPGQAAVVVSVVHVSKTPSFPNPLLNGRAVNRISAYLLAGDVDDSPAPLSSETTGILAALGNKPNGKGFIFSDRGSDYLPLSDKDALLSSNPEYRSVLKPYMGGSELNSNAELQTDRWIVDFESRDKTAAAQYTKLFALVEERVRPYVSRDNWWQFEHRAVAVQRRLSEVHLKDLLVIAETSDTFAFAFVPTDICFSNKIIIFTTDSREVFACLQSRVHECWARCVSSTMKDDLSYVPGDCFDTFPFPKDDDGSAPMCEAGGTYYESRRKFMLREDIGLTDTYNRFHDPHEQSLEILQLRELHTAMDRAVLEAYGWHDLAAAARCEFLLDYEEEDGDQRLGVGDQGESQSATSPKPETRNPAPARRRRLPWRLRWPDDFRDEVLARLLELNEQRHREEVLAGKAGVRCRVAGGGEDEQEGGDEDGEQSAESGEKKARKSGKPRKARKKPATGQQEMEF